jgi:hypothetical protein
VTPGPALTAFLKSNRAVGTLVILTGENGVRVWVNGKEQATRTQDGRLRIPGLEIAKYAIRVEKEGFLSVPEQQASVRKGEEARLEVHLQPIPTNASLVISGGVAGAQVLIDQAAIGTILEDGSLSTSVPTGDHVVELRKDPYLPRKFEKHFEAGGVVRLSAAEVALEKALGKVVVKVTPTDAQLTISRGGEPAQHLAEGTTSLPEGSYTVTARAPNYLERNSKFNLAAGETKDVALVLERAPNKVRVADMADWDDLSGWTTAGEWRVRRGGNFVGFKSVPTNGVFQFTIRLERGRHLQWVLARTDDQNYVLFQMDKKTFYRSQFVKGRQGPQTKVSHNLDTSVYTLRIDVKDDEVIHSSYDGSKWIVFDDWRVPGGKFSIGKFGFLLPGSDTIGLSHFTFTPR